MIAGLIYSNNRVPIPMPISEAGTNMRSSGKTHLPRYAHKANTSIRHRMGSRIAAARTGDTISAISGTAIMPKPAPKPPLDIPNMMTAGTATA